MTSRSPRLFGLTSLGGIAVVLPVLVTGCANTTEPTLRGGVLATFQVSGETFRAFVTNEDAIDDILALDAGLSDASIPNGALLRGPGSSGHNRPWSWHVDSEDIVMADATIELCDGRPSLVEANLDEWVDVVGRFCPWGAELVLVEDFR